MLRVSVVVPTYRRPELLDRCLTALAAQDLAPDEFEILVADDAADLATRDQIRAFVGPNRPVVRWLPVTGRHGPAAARNTGRLEARAPVVAFTDDDCLPEPGWLRAGLKALADGGEAASGRVVVPLPANPTDYERDASGLEGAEFVTANCFCRRAALAVIDGFDERFATAWREDSDLHFGLLEAGFRIVRAPDAVVVHPVRPAPWGVSLRQQRKSLFDALLFKKHPELYRRRIRAAPPWDYYAIAVSLVVAMLGIVWARPAAVAAGLLVWLALTARFCLRRLRGTSRAPEHVAEMVFTSVLIPPLSIYWRLRGAWRFGVLFL